MGSDYHVYWKKAIDLGSALFDYYKGRGLTPTQIELIAEATDEEKIYALQKTAEYRLLRNFDASYQRFCTNIQKIFESRNWNVITDDELKCDSDKERETILGRALLSYYKGRTLEPKDIKLIANSSNAEENINAMEFYSECNLSVRTDGSYMRFCQNKQDIINLSKEIVKKKTK